MTFQIQNIESISNLKNIHTGERLFIIGTGPSLLQTNLNLLKGEILFGVNRLFLGYDTLNIECQYYAASDPSIPYLQQALELNTKLFLGHGAYDQFISQYISRKDEIVRMPLLLPLLGWMWLGENNFSKDITKGTFNGWTIICDIPLQVAFYMGFTKVYLLGCDWDFAGAITHFYSNKKGPVDPEFYNRTSKSYEICKKIYENDRREIINLTNGGKLEIFKRQTLEDVI